MLSPRFLFRIEHDPDPAAATAHPLDDYEIASRLSYFLWSSMPDDALFTAAASQRMHTAGDVAAQVERMLRDPKAEALVESFGGQWLKLGNLAGHEVDKATFPTFDTALKNDMRAETLAAFRDFLSGALTLPQMMTTDRAYVTERLARHYDLPVTGLGAEPIMVRVPGGARGGLLTQGSMLLSSSRPNRTSPVLRGKWILETLLCTAPPPPPSDVPTQLDASAGPLTLRQQLERHRASPVCAGCHDLIDPLGFGLEGFDATGRYRTIDGGHPVDATGTLPDGRRFSGAGELAAILAADARLTRCLLEHLMIYALGREIDPTTDDHVIERLAAATDDKAGFRDMAKALVTSTPFLWRRAQATQSAGSSP